jgi:hypothetical protein
MQELEVASNLGELNRRDTTTWVKDANRDVLLAPKTINGSASVRKTFNELTLQYLRSLHQARRFHVEDPLKISEVSLTKTLGFSPTKKEIKQIAKKLQSNIFESKCWPME